MDPHVASALPSSMPTSLIDIILGYAQRWFRGVSFRCDCTVFLDNGPDVQNNMDSFVARTTEGSLRTWGHAKFPKRLKNVRALCGGWREGFAAIVGEDHRVVSWGWTRDIEDLSAVQDIMGICGSAGAFAALRRDGRVFTWGSSQYGGEDMPRLHETLEGVKAIYSTESAFAAVLHDGTVEAWGRLESGGAIPPSVKERLKQVQCITGNTSAFAAVLSDGTVETWGKRDEGGDSSEVAGKLTQVVLVCASRQAFAALRKDGTVIFWGRRSGGELTRVAVIGSSTHAFAAVQTDGSVVIRGVGFTVDHSQIPKKKLHGVVALRGIGTAFAALRKDGTVTTWGDRGGRLPVKSELKGVVDLFVSGGAFAALRSDGSVVTWGQEDRGGVEVPPVFEKRTKEKGLCGIC